MNKVQAKSNTHAFYGRMFGKQGKIALLSSTELSDTALISYDNISLTSVPQIQNCARFVQGSC